MIGKNLADRRTIMLVKQTMDVKLNEFGLKIRRLENDRNTQRGRIIRLESEVSELKEKLKDKGEK